MFCRNTKAFIIQRAIEQPINANGTGKNCFTGCSCIESLAPLTLALALVLGGSWLATGFSSTGFSAGFSSTGWGTTFSSITSHDSRGMYITSSSVKINSGTA